MPAPYLKDLLTRLPQGDLDPKTTDPATVAHLTPARMAGVRRQHRGNSAA